MGCLDPETRTKYNQRQRAGVVQWQNRRFPSFGRGLDAAFFDTSQQQLSEPIYRGFFAAVKPFWTVLDPIEHLSPSESAAWRAVDVGSIPIARSITHDDSIGLTHLNYLNPGQK